MSALSCRNLHKHFRRGQQPAVGGVSLDIPSGSILSLVGESGSGKTTLLRMLAGLEIPDHGTITIGDAPAFDPQTNLPPEKRNLGLVFQNGALFPHLTVAKNITYGVRHLKRSQRKAKVDEMLDLVGLSGYAKRYPNELSGGESQRIALARALAPEPDVLLLDEPFSNLDPTLRKRLREDVGRILHSTKTTALFVTHDTEDALTIANEIAVMRDGKLLQVGEPARLYRNPCDAYCAHLFGPANQLPEDWIAGVAANPARGQVESGWVWVRPDQLEVVNAHGDGSLEVTVLEVRYKGDRQELLVKCNDLGEQADNLTLYWEGQATIQAGNRLWVRPKVLTD